MIARGLIFSIILLMLSAGCGKASEPMTVKVRIENDLLVWDEKTNGPILENAFSISDIHNVTISKDESKIEFSNVGNPFFTTNIFFSNGYLQDFAISPQTNALALEDAQAITFKLHNTVLSWGFVDQVKGSSPAFTLESGVSRETGEKFERGAYSVENPEKGWDAIVSDPRKPAIIGISDLRTKNLTFQMRVIDLYRYQGRGSKDDKRYKVEASFFISRDNESLKKAMLQGPPRTDLGDSNLVSSLEPQ